MLDRSYLPASPRDSWKFAAESQFAVPLLSDCKVANKVQSAFDKPVSQVRSKVPVQGHKPVPQVRSKVPAQGHTD